MTTESKRIFEYKDDKSSKFWEVKQTEVNVVVRYGKTGTNGQSREKVFGDTATATEHVAKLISEKIGKGYAEVGANLSTGNSAAVTSKVSAKLTNQSVHQAKVNAVRKTKAAKPKNIANVLEATSESLMDLLDKDDATNRLLAKHKSASAELLEKLSHSSDQATRRQVAGNPNTPPGVLIKLGQQFPKDFLANPALDLLMFTSPTFMDDIPVALLIRLLKQAACPESLLNWAAGHRDEKVQLAVVMNASTPEHALKGLCVSEHVSVQKAVNALSDHVTPIFDPEIAFEQSVCERLSLMTLNELWLAWSEGDIGLPHWNALPQKFQLDLATNGRYANILAIALRKSVKKSFDDFINNPEIEIREVVAGHPATPVSVLEVLARASSVVVRYAVAGNISTPKSLLGLLSKDSDNYVRSSVASNSSTPVAVLEEIFKEKNSKIQYSIASNPSATVDMLQALARSRDLDVRLAVAANPSTPLPIKNKLLKAFVRKDECDIEDLKEIVKNPAMPTLVLEEVFEDTFDHARFEAMKNPALSVTQLDALSARKSIRVRAAVAENPSTPTKVLERLASDRSISVVTSALGNRNTPHEVVVRHLTSKHTAIRMAIATQAHRSPEIWRVLLRDTEQVVRLAVLGCKQLPRSVLEEYLQCTYCELELVTLLEHPNIGEKSAEIILDRLFNAPPKASAWYRRAISNASLEVKAAAMNDTLLTYIGNDPNKAVLAKRPLAAVMALCAGAFVEPRRLARLSESPDWMIRAGVARNLGTPPNIVLKLATDPHPVVAAMANKAQAISIKSAVQAAPLVVSIDTTRVVDEVLERLRDHRKLLHQALGDPVWAELLSLPDLIGSTAYGPLFPLADLNLEEKHLATVCEVGVKLSNSKIRCRFAEDLSCSREAIKLLAHDEDPNVVMSAMCHPQFQPGWYQDAVQNLLSLKGAKLLEVVRSAHAPVEVLEAKANSKSMDIRQAIARNPSTPVAILLKMTKDPNELVRIEVAQNPSTPLDILRSFSTDSEERVRGSAASNPSLPISVIQEALIEYKSVRSIVGRNPFTSEIILVDLSKDSDAWVNAVVARNPSANHQILEYLSQSEFFFVRYEVAKNTSTSADILEHLASDQYGGVREYVAENPSTPVAVLNDLARDNNFKVRQAAEKNPSTQLVAVKGLMALLQRVIERESSHRENKHLQSRVPVDHVDILRALGWLGCLDPRSDNKKLTKASRSKDWLTRLGVALHTSATNGILKLLNNDDDPDVARAASNALTGR